MLTHLSRRTHLGQAKQLLKKHLKAEDLERIVLLMDSRGNAQRYEAQLAEDKAANPEAYAEDE